MFNFIFLLSNYNVYVCSTLSFSSVKNQAWINLLLKVGKWINVSGFETFWTYAYFKIIDHTENFKNSLDSSWMSLGFIKFHQMVWYYMFSYLNLERKSIIVMEYRAMPGMFCFPTFRDVHISHNKALSSWSKDIMEISFWQSIYCPWKLYWQHEGSKNTSNSKE